MLIGPMSLNGEIWSFESPAIALLKTLYLLFPRQIIFPDVKSVGYCSHVHFGEKMTGETWLRKMKTSKIKEIKLTMQGIVPATCSIAVVVQF